MQQLLLKSNMLQSPFILGEGRNSLKGTETGSSGGREAAIQKKARGFILVKNFAFPSAKEGLGAGDRRPVPLWKAPLRQLGEEEKQRKPHRREEKKKMAQRLSPDRRQGDFPGRNRGPKETPGEPMGSGRGPPEPPLAAAGAGGGRGGREGAAFGSSMGTMGPVSAEPGLSLWDAMSARPARRGAAGRGEGSAGATLTVRSEIRLDLRGEQTGRDRQQRRPDGGF